MEGLGLKKRIIIVALLMILSMVLPAHADIITVEEVYDYMEEVGSVFEVTITGKLDGLVWGNGIYTSDSDIETAAVHAGIVKPRERKTVKISIMAGQKYYEGTLRNGVTTEEYDEYSSSFKFTDIGLPLAPQTTTDALKNIESKAEDLDLAKYPVGTEINVIVTGKSTGSVWGNGIYSSDSDIGVAAVHAGLVKKGETKTLKITVLAGQAYYEGVLKNGIESYNYEGEWEASFKFNDTAKTPSEPIAPVNPENNRSDVFSQGVIMSWQAKGVLGYRLFRSTSESELGISVTDFYITVNSFADVNVDPNTTYYYTVKTVLAEADPVNGKEEVLGDIIARYTLKTGSEVTKSENKKNFIVLKIDNPYMSVNGKSQEIDPGRGTTPIIVSSRSMVPIRAIVETMGGTVGWNNDTQQITLTANGNTVNMWIGKNEITVNGVKRNIDVAPFIKNGRTYVPVRFSAENLNAKVDWINSTQEAVITYVTTSSNTVVNPQTPPVPVENPQITVPPESQPVISAPETQTPQQPGNTDVPVINDGSGGMTAPEPVKNPGNTQYSTPSKPVFIMEDRYEKVSKDEGKVTFMLKRPIYLGDYTGFRLYFSDKGESQIFEFAEDAFAYTEKVGLTVELEITTLNGTVESKSQKLIFAMLNKVKGKTIWSEYKEQNYNLMGSPCWYGLNWEPVEGATKYSVYVSKDISSYLNFVDRRDLSGFSNVIVNGTSFSTKVNTGLPEEVANATWGEDRYVVVFPVNEDGIPGPFPRYYKITMTGI